MLMSDLFLQLTSSLGLSNAIFVMLDRMSSFSITCCICCMFLIPVGTTQLKYELCLVQLRRIDVCGTDLNELNEFNLVKLNHAEQKSHFSTVFPL